ncbi:kinesin-like protein KIF23 isoform X2 [Anneissia japonica]|uniref:kinesin-like protein KIF23 isoform X2 n=1 Tax=Anneissia japonica TaxID=1529436 RepID=UPI0014256E68|nr:kinesin-like protein KIF23 isoform X2 [Anneissia japonica]
MKPTRGKTPKKPPRRLVNKDKDPVEVYCRIRPPDGDADTCIEVVNSTTIQLKAPENSHAYRNGLLKENQYTFKFVFPVNTSQKALFDRVSLPLIDDLLHGRNGLLFMYGITGSGKTHTMQGTPGDGGILPRALDVLFNSIGELQAKKYVFHPDLCNCMDVQTEADAMMERQKRELMAPLKTPSTPATPRSSRKNDLANMVRVPDTTSISNVDEDNNYAVFVSYIEIYNNYIYDLLEEAPVDPIMTPKSLPSKTLREDASHNMYVAGCTEVEVKSTDEAYAVFMKGQKRRRVAHTQLNTESSRSHSVFNIRLVQAPLDPLGEEVLQDKNQICISQLSLVDLAGSERTNRTKNSGDRLREAGNINASLMTLRTCIDMLRDNQKNGTSKIVPYRDSKVTHLFKNYFDGEGKVRMIVCVNPQSSDYDETIHVMRFSEATQEVQITRATDIKFDIGLTPGRRRAHQIYRKMVEEGLNEDDVPVPPPMITLGPPFPFFEINDPEDTSIQNLIGFLVEREKRRNTLNKELKRLMGSFRTQVLDLENEVQTLRQQNSQLQSQADSQSKEINRYQAKLKEKEAQNGMLHRTHQLYEEDRRGLQTELDAKLKAISREKQEKDKLRQALKGVANSEKEKWAKECDKRVRAKQLEMQNKIWVKDEKLRQLKEIVCAREAASNKARERKAALAHNRSKSPPPKRNPPPVKLRHRRSRSATDNVWIDHKPSSTIGIETVMQPSGVKKKKTITNVKAVKDVKAASNYMLTHQEEDSKGEIETKIFKGDIFETRGGGRSVQFTDVEKLRQELPGSTERKSVERKRRASDEENSGEWTDVETRCAVGIHGTPGATSPALTHIVPQKKFKV